MLNVMAAMYVGAITLHLHIAAHIIPMYVGAMLNVSEICYNAGGVLFTDQPMNYGPDRTERILTKDFTDH